MELVENPYVSEFTRKTLEQFDWKDGDPIPVVLGDTLLKFKEQATGNVLARTDVLVDAALMQEEDVAAVKALLAEAKTAGEDLKKRQTKQQELEKIAPQLRAQYETVMGQLEIVDDREHAAEEVAPAQVAQENTPATRAAPPEPPPEPEPPAPTMTPAILPFCPRCGWDMRQKFEAMPTDRDKEDFLATLLGGSRFRKRYELLGGKIIVTLRGLLAEENKLIYRQLVLDQQANKIATESEWFVQMMDYRLACSLESIAISTGKVIAVVPELSEMPFTPDKEQPLVTPLVAQLHYVNNTVLAQEVTRRLVGLHLRQFQRLLEALEAMALEPSFWTGIE
jgi:hypothetical protein